MAKVKTKVKNADGSESEIETDAPADPNRAAEQGDIVRLVLGNGDRIDAEVKHVRKSPKIGVDRRLVDLTFRFRAASEEDSLITSAPFDPTGKKCDSWSWLEATTAK